MFILNDLVWLRDCERISICRVREFEFFNCVNLVFAG